MSAFDAVKGKLASFIQKYAKYASMQVTKYTSMQVCSYGHDLQNFLVLFQYFILQEVFAPSPLL